ncbi:MAG TPA: hypothetical protein VKZ72_10880 [Acidimicrobiales bacterium]|nr:hypothetical protein [Acidimicrobiales bacterium]
MLCLDPALALEWAPENPAAETWPEGQEPIKITTGQSNLKQLRLALVLMDRYDLIEPDDDDWARATMLMRRLIDRADKRDHAELAAGTLRGRLQQLRSLWSVRTIIDRPTMLGTEPLGTEESTEVFGAGARPKRNMRRPHQDVGRCLGMVAWMFDNIADDVLAHLRWWSESTASADDAPASRDEGYQAMVDLLDEVASTLGVLPAVVNNSGNPTLAHTALASLLGLHDADEAFLWGRYAMRRFRDVPLEVEGGNPCPLPTRALPLADGSGEVTWTPRLLNTNDELQWWSSTLVYCGMFYVAAVCGMRDLDLDCLPLGCANTITKTRPTGETYEVTKVRGYKQKNRQAPIPTTWTVSERVSRVLNVIGELHQIHGITPSINSHTGERRLFDPQLITASNRSGRDSIHLDLGYMNWLTEAARRLHQRGLTRDSLEDVTKLNVAQIRITALQAYASRPLGNVLAAEFGQWSTQSVGMGYYGDVTKIIHLADPRDADSMIHEDTGRTLARAAKNIGEFRGNGVDHLQDVIARHAGTLANDTPLSQARLKTLGKKNANLRTGPYTLCLYRPEMALCGGQGAADFRLCRPHECKNSAMSRAHRALVELRRRQELQMAPILRRNAEKIATAMPAVIEEFADITNNELAAIAAEDLDSYIREALNEDPSE